MSEFVATITGIPSLSYVNARVGPGTNNGKVGKIDKGVSGLKVLAVEPDQLGKGFNGKTYQWFKLQTPLGPAWVRDDLITVQGDGGQFGYDNISTPTLAFDLKRGAPKAPAAPAAEPAKAASSSAAVLPPLPDEKPQQPAETKVPEQQKAPEAPPSPDDKAAAGSVPVATGKEYVAKRKGEPILISMAQNGSNARPGPGTASGNRVFKLPYKAQAKIIGVAKDPADKRFYWYQIEYNGQTGWVREDYQRLISGFEQFGVQAEDLYPAPTENTWWVRDYNYGDLFNSSVFEHWGWDLGGNIGEPIMCGPHGGTVIKAATCPACGSAGRSSVQAGFSVGDPRVWNDPNWNYGLGHFVIIRYDHDMLPDSTKNYLAQKGFSGAHIFTLYAHLSGFSVKAGDTLGPYDKFAKLGNSGNSSGPHLHLEIRAGTNREATWASIKNGLMTPAVLFLR